MIAAIWGWCIGGGVDLITAADFRYASADAKFSIREVKVGMVADMGTLARSPAIIGDGHFRELALTGRDIDAARAERIGLVNDVFDDAEATLAAARAAATEIADNPPLVVHGIKRVPRPGTQRRGRRQPAVRRRLECRVPAVQRPVRGDHGHLRKAQAEFHRRLSRSVRPGLPPGRTGSINAPQPEHRDLPLRALLVEIEVGPYRTQHLPRLGAFVTAEFSWHTIPLPAAVRDTDRVGGTHVVHPLRHGGGTEIRSGDRRSAPSGADNSRVRRTMPLYARAHRG